MGIALISFALAACCLWGARRGGESSVVRFKLYWAGMCFIALAVGAAYVRLLEWRSPGEVAQYLPPYPRATICSRSPVPVDNAKAWVFETPHSPKVVADFYAKIAHTNGWEMKREAADKMEVLVLRQYETVTTILAMPASGTPGRGSKTEITYLVRAAAPRSD
jgi:hypothetical protein